MRLRDNDEHEAQPDEAEMLPPQHARRARLHDEDDAATASLKTAASPASPAFGKKPTCGKVCRARVRKAHRDFVAKWRNATATADETPLFRLRLDRSASPFEIAAPSAHCSGLLSIREDGRWCGDIDNEEECEDSMIDGALRPTPRPGYALCYWHHGACRNPGAEARVLYCTGSGVEGVDYG